MLDGTQETQPSPSTSESKDAPPAAKPEDGKEPPKEGEADKAAPEKVDPASYELKVPEGYKLDDDMSKEVRQYAADRNMKQDDVNALLAMGVKLQQRQFEKYEQVTNEWSDKVMADKEIGGANWDASKVHGNRAVSHLFDPEFISEVLVGYKLGTHPGFVRAMVKLGKQIGEGSMVGRSDGSKGSGPKTLEERLYGTSGNAIPKSQS